MCAANPPELDVLKGKALVFMTLSIMLATSMQMLDTTIANVALPNMQGALGTTEVQIAWVLTSYIIASAIAMPLTGILSLKFGRKRLFMVAVAGFTLASMLCGAAQSLSQLVLFRLMQGVFGACLVPLSQAAMLDHYPREKHGAAMAMWGMGVTIAPILGPLVGGWLTEHYNWRWVFYINVPLGVISLLGIFLYLPETAKNQKPHFDLVGFLLLAVGIGALQLLLDRGEMLDWFVSGEIVIESIIAALALAMFFIHSFTCRKPFVNPNWFRDRNFSVGLLLAFVSGFILLSTIALAPPFLQKILGYTVLDVGTLLIPRGIGSITGMMIVGRLANRVDLRLLMASGTLLMCFALWEMVKFNLDTGAWDIIWTGYVQGMGLGFIYVPLATLTFSTLAPQFRNDGTALFNLLRSIGGSIGISLVMSYLSRSATTLRAVFHESITPFRLPAKIAIEAGIIEIENHVGLMRLDMLVSKQASLMAFLLDFRFMMFVSLVTMPLILLFKAQPSLAKKYTQQD